jgi:glyoxylase-like metal-dependent hydrolase (beta-lactamase superfamily II)
MEVVPGVHRIRDRFFKNIYLIVNGEAVLIDTGLPGSYSDIMSYLRLLQMEKRQLRTIVLTHSHIDHMGSARRVAAATGAEVWAHHLDAPHIEGVIPVHGYDSNLEMLTHTLTRARRARVDRRLSEGDRIECLGGLEVIHTPGHTEGSICLYQRERGVLFSGDTVQYSWGRIRAPMRVFCHDSGRVRESMKRIAQLEFYCMLSGEGAPLLSGADEKVREYLTRFEDR